MSDQSKALDRIGKLMRLATNNPNDDEARTAALQAVKLIQQHGFVVSVKAAPPASVRPVGNPFTAGSGAAAESLVDYMRRRQAQQQSAYEQYHANMQAEMLEQLVEARRQAREAERMAKEAAEQAKEYADEGLTHDGKSWWSKAAESILGPRNIFG